MRKLLVMLDHWATMLRERISPRRADQVTLDTLRADRSVQRMNEAIAQIQADSVLRRRVRLMERRPDRRITNEPHDPERRRSP